MKNHSTVRFLNSRFKRALVVEEPSIELDQELVAQGIVVDRVPSEATQDRDLILRLLREHQHDLLYKRSRLEVDEEILTASKSLAAVMLCCIGDDSVDKVACANHGVMVMNDPVSNGRSVVELVIGEIICMARRIFDANDQSRENRWTKNSRCRYEIQGKWLGIAGLGNIGKGVAQTAQALGMKIAFWDSNPVTREVGETLGWYSCRNIEELFKISDVVTVHLSAEDHSGKSNRGLLNFNHFALLGSERGENSPRLFLNAARGFLFDPEDLIRAVEEGYVHGASVDVFPEEPGASSDAWTNPYADYPQIVSTPHIGAATQEAQPRIARKMAHTTEIFDKFGTVRDTVFQPKIVTGVDVSDCEYILAVVHSDVRGTKKAVADAIYEAGLNNLESSHRDFPKYGIAYDVSALDGPLSDEQMRGMIESAKRISGVENAIRSVRLIRVNDSSDS